VSPRRSPAPAIVAALVGVTALVGGCMPAPATEQAKSIAGLYTVFLGGGVIVAILVWGLATFAVLRFRRRVGDETIPRQVRGSVRVEAIWTGIPLLTVLGLFVLTVTTLNTVSAVDPQPGVNLDITAFRWGWTFRYTARDVSITSVPGDEPDVVVPVGETVHVTLASVDVNHAFFVPRFLFKRDAIPGRVTTFDFRVVAPGVYPGTCAEFCGIYHAQMGFTIRGVPVPDFEAWLALQPRTPPAPSAPSAPPVSSAPSASSPPSAPSAP
jgi:cytochrome c oxidase subunit 2